MPQQTLRLLQLQKQNAGRTFDIMKCCHYRSCQHHPTGSGALASCSWPRIPRQSSLLPWSARSCTCSVLKPRSIRRPARWARTGDRASDGRIDRQPLTEACGWEQIPRYLVRDRDGAYGEIFLRRVRSIGIRDRPTSPRSPW